MGLLANLYELKWVMGLAEGGYSCWELHDEHGRRWGWAVNAAPTGWTAHLGDWGQAQALGLAPVQIEQQIRHCATSTEARSWIEDEVAAEWKREGSQ